MKLNISHPNQSSEFVYKTPAIKKRTIEVPGRPIKRQPARYKINPNICTSLFTESYEKENLDPNRHTVNGKLENIQHYSMGINTDVISHTGMRTPPHTATYKEIPQRPIKNNKDNFFIQLNGALSLFNDEHNHDKKTHIMNTSQNNIQLPPPAMQITSSQDLTVFGNKFETSKTHCESVKGTTSMECLKKTASIDSLLSGATTHDHSDQSDDEINSKKQKSENKAKEQNDKLGTCKIQFAPPAMLQQMPEPREYHSLFRPIHPIMQNNVHTHIIHKPMATRPTSGIAFRTTFNK